MGIAYHRRVGSAAPAERTTRAFPGGRFARRHLSTAADGLRRKVERDAER